MWQSQPGCCLDRTEEGLRRTFIVDKYVKDFIWNVINLTSNSLSFRLAPSPGPILFLITPTRGDKSHCEPGQSPVLMASCLQTCWAVSQGSRSLAPSRSESYIILLYLNDLWPCEAFNVATPGKNINTQKGCITASKAPRRQLQPYRRSRHNARIGVKNSCKHTSTQTLLL